MAFTVETGTGVSGANALASVSDVDSYLSDRGYALWAALTTSAKQYHIVKATDFLVANFSFNGIPYAEGQALPFPRSYLFDANDELQSGVPGRVTQAVALLAEYSRAGHLEDVEVIDSGVIRERFGPLEVEMSGGGSGSSLGRFPLVLRLLKPLLAPQPPLLIN